MRTQTGHGRGTRAGTRTVFAAAALVLALFTGVDVAAAGGGRGEHSRGNRVAALGPVVPESLLAQAAASPERSFRVILQGRRAIASATLADFVTRGDNSSWSDTTKKGRLRRQFRVISGVSVSLTGSDLLKLARNVFIASIVPDAPVATTGWQESIGVPSLWSHAASTCGLAPLCSPVSAYLAPQAPAIAVVDSGVDATKAVDFGARVVARQDFVGDGAVGDPEGHGTMVAGVAAGASTATTGGGVAQNAPIVDVRVAGAQGQAYTSDVVAGLDWVLANKARYGIGVVNLSLAGTSEASVLYDPLDQAVEKLWLNGLVVVAAAGNHGSADGPVKMPAPGNDPFVITVGAVDTNGTDAPGDDFRAPWSAYGYTADGFLKPELTAPGRHMVMPVPDGAFIPGEVPDRVVAPGYMWMSGTSFAAPAVAGAAAQLLALHPDWTPDLVKGALLASAARLGSEGTGIGEVDAAAAAAVASPPNPNENLDTFVQADPATGLQVFGAANWTAAVSTSANWTSANWTSANWTSANWTSANWTSANWTSANWTSANWTSATLVK
jgi:serine protease AprX